MEKPSQVPTIAGSVLRKIGTLAAVVLCASVVVGGGAVLYLGSRPSHGVACTLGMAISDPAGSPEAAFDVWRHRANATYAKDAPLRRSDFFRTATTEWRRPLGGDRYQKVEVTRVRGHDGQWIVTGANTCSRVPVA